MEAFFLSIASLIAFLVIVTALCVMLRFGTTQRAAAYQGVAHLAHSRRRHHLVGGTLAVGLILLFSATLMMAILSK